MSLKMNSETKTNSLKNADIPKISINNNLKTITNEMSENNVLTIMTSQIGPFKTLISALKDIIADTNIIFTKNSMKIINIDASHTVVVFLELLADNFEVYNCKLDKIIIGTNLIRLSKLIDTIENNETLTIYISNEHYDNGIVSFLSLKFDNISNNQYTIHQLRLMDVDTEEMIYPDISFSSMITFPSVEFMKIIRKLSNTASDVQIMYANNELKFESKGCTYSNTTITKFGEGLIQKCASNKIIFQGLFALKYLNYFTKCTNLSSQVDLYLENDKPLVIEYAVASLGKIRLCLSSKNNDI